MTTIDKPIDSVASAASVRQDRLAEKVKGLRSGRGPAQLDRWMLILGGFLLPFGVLLLLLGWRGAADTPLVFEQVPYLISGGLLGLALVFAGGFIYFAYWLTLLVRENREGRAELSAVLTRVEGLLAQSTLNVGPVRTAGGARADTLVATKTGTMLHRPDCVAVDGKSDLRTVTADTPGLSACKLCDPLG